MKRYYEITIIFSLFHSSSVIKKKVTTVVEIRNKNWILKSRVREKIIMKYGVLRHGYLAKNNFSSIMSLSLLQSVQDMAWKCNV